MNFLLSIIAFFRRLFHTRRDATGLEGREPGQRRRGANQAGDNPLRPFHRESRVVQIGRIGKNGRVEASAEEYHNTDDGLIARTDAAIVVTSSNLAVKPEAIKGQCSSCKGFDVEIHRCAKCHTLLCGSCFSVFDAGKGKQELCRRCFKKAKNSFDTWSAQRREQKGKA